MSTQTQPQTSAGPPRAEQLLATEIAIYQNELPRLLADGEEGRWALIQGSVVAGVWDTFADAVQAGDERFGATPFLVQQVLAEPHVARITRAVR
jgi:hypothetical protein